LVLFISWIIIPLGSFNFLLFIVDMDMNLYFALQSECNCCFMSVCLAIIYQHATYVNIAPLNLFAVFH
jgi:hypothetical protein